MKSFRSLIVVGTAALLALAACSDSTSSNRATQDTAPTSSPESTQSSEVTKKGQTKIVVSQDSHGSEGQNPDVYSPFFVTGTGVPAEKPGDEFSIQIFEGSQTVKDPVVTINDVTVSSEGTISVEVVDVLSVGTHTAALFEEDSKGNKERLAKDKFSVIKDPTPAVKGDFNLVSLCQVNAKTVRVGVVNKWNGSAAYTISKYQTGPSFKGVAQPSKNPYVNTQDVPFTSSKDTWILRITDTDFSYIKAVGSQEACED